MSLDLGAIRQRLNATTPGTWEWPADHSDIFTVVAWTESNGGEAHDIHCETEADAEFVANAKNDISLLLEEVERLNALLSRQ
jgi:hypothetical protein